MTLPADEPKLGRAFDGAAIPGTFNAGQGEGRALRAAIPARMSFRADECDYFTSGL